MKYILITIDTEGDNLWKIKATDTNDYKITNKNGEYLQRFQELCERYNFIPTYLTNYEMAKCESFVEMAKFALKKGNAEIGMHMHAWNSPPISPLKFYKNASKPYLGEYSSRIIFEKLKMLNNILQDIFEINITSHRGGRWYIDTNIIKCLEKLNYKVDCTVCPGIDWRSARGYTKYSKGRNYKKYQDKVFPLRKKGNMLEIPVTIKKRGNEQIWMRPDRNNIRELLWLVNQCYYNDERYIEFMIHSSELMPGGSPTFKTNTLIEKLYENLEVLFSELHSKGYVGIGLTDFANKYKL